MTQGNLTLVSIMTVLDSVYYECEVFGSGVSLSVYECVHITYYLF